MDGKPREGTFPDLEGNWWKVEERHYPKTRWVIRPVSMDKGIPRIVGTETPDLTLEHWAGLQEWL